MIDRIDRRNIEINMSAIEEQDPQTYRIIGAAMEVHRELGSGFLEAVYQEALALELEERMIPSKREVHLPINYKGNMLSCAYRADFICYDEIIVELKVLAMVVKANQAQVYHYLKEPSINKDVN
jgi:GxxExxY protein